MSDYVINDSAHSNLGQATMLNKQAKDKADQQRRISDHASSVAAGRVVPDLNPADRAVERMAAHAQHMKDYSELPPPSRNADLRDRVTRLENILQLTLDSLNAATITCSGGSVVLTLPALPT